ncbi:PhzF family phenazine biosynthesis protein [Streptosporangium sp. KLBMP 9127]|nr:PhzF family phenazine biosynthesis protein [Streptosporangium sp. KLBMP 9127]
MPPPKGLAEASRATPSRVGRSEFDLLVEAEIDPGTREPALYITDLTSIDTSGVSVTAAAAAAPDPAGVARFFAPRAGAPKALVTGSAHRVLAPYRSAELGRKAILCARHSQPSGFAHPTNQDEHVIAACHAVTILNRKYLPKPH